jgi:hypothetical protein
VLLGLKAETGYSSTNIILIKMYKNSILIKFWRKFEIEIKEEKTRLGTFLIRIYGRNNR